MLDILYTAKNKIFPVNISMNYYNPGVVVTMCLVFSEPGSRIIPVRRCHMDAVQGSFRFQLTWQNQVSLSYRMVVVCSMQYVVCPGWLGQNGCSDLLQNWHAGTSGDYLGTFFSFSRLGSPRALRAPKGPFLGTLRQNYVVLQF